MLALIFMITFTIMAFQVILWQSQDISVSIVSETDEGTSEVTISVLNTAGSTLLFHENAEMTGKIEYLSEEGWVEYCDVSYTASNADAISTQYGGTFAELEPGEDWDVAVPESKISGMKNGTYRIKMTYITEKAYNEYLEDAFESRNESKEDISDVSVPHNLVMNTITEIAGTTEVSESDDDIEAEDFLAESACEVFVKTFEYTAPEDFVDEISIDGSDIESTKAPRAKIKQVN